MSGRTHAVFVSPYDVRDALDRLEQDGVATSDIEVRSSAPLDHDVFPHSHAVHSRMPWMALTGAVLGGTGLFSLVAWSSSVYPLPTGGMPIVAVPTTGIITFEGIAIGAILCTVATVLYECGLPGFRSAGAGPLDHHLADDCVLVTVRCTDDASLDWAEKAAETARD
jgi:hypothetical protein